MMTEVSSIIDPFFHALGDLFLCDPVATRHDPRYTGTINNMNGEIVSSRSESIELHMSMAERARKTARQRKTLAP